MSIISKEFWQRKCEYHIQMYEYGRYTKAEFLTHMNRMGWDKEIVLELLEEE